MPPTSPLPPGQSETKKFPVVGERAPSAAALDLARWRLSIAGRVERPLILRWDDWCALPKEDGRADLHCVTGWTRRATAWSGVPLARLLASAGPLGDAQFVRFEAYSERAHDTSLPLALALADTWLVDAIDGAPLTPEHGFPLRTLTPSRYFYKSLKWVARIELLATDRLGYWERESSYHNVGDPTSGQQRFSSGSIDPAALQRFVEATDFSLWRAPRQVLLGVDLRAWRPRSTDLSGLRIKASDLRGARLRGCDLRGANFSLSDLRGADLSGARLVGADLEGAHLEGADLTGADLSGAALSAAIFASEGSPGPPTRVEGLRLEGARGLLEGQEAWLAAQGLVWRSGD